MKAIILASLLFATASAHTIFTDLIVDGTLGTRYVGMRLPSYDGPIQDVTSQYMSCNGGDNPLVLISNQKLVVTAGQTVTLKWAHTLTSPDTDVIDASHLGPIMVYMAKVSDAVTSPAPKDGWFKIYEDGYSNGKWAVSKLIANKGLVSVTIPSCIAPGDYLLRGELIALHAAQNYPGAQFYMECAQLTVQSSGTATPPTVSFPGAYSGSDPGVKFNLYNGFTSYPIPGPRPFVCGSEPSPSRSPSPSPSPSRSPSPSPSPSPSRSPSPITGPCGTKSNQCDGKSFTGNKCCVAGLTCTYISEWYSQCR